MSADVTQADAIRFCEVALRNSATLCLSNEDIEDIRGALAMFATTHRLAATKAMQEDSKARKLLAALRAVMPYARGERQRTDAGYHHAITKAENLASTYENAIRALNQAETP